MGLFRKRGGANKISGEDRSPQLGLKYKDLATMDQFIKAGANLTEPRHVIYYLYAPTRDTARAMADESTMRGFDTAVREPLPPYPNQWSLHCETRAVVAPDFVRDNTDFFESLASRYRAEYDGWEAAV